MDLELYSLDGLLVANDTVEGLVLYRLLINGQLTDTRHFLTEQAVTLK